MGKWIRWWGLGVFVVVLGLMVAVWMLCVDRWIKGLIEDVGTQAVGAKVELDAAEVTLVPAGLALTRLQVTDPKAPMTNAVEVARIRMGLDSLNLLGRKVIIEEMTVDGVRLGTPRTVSGAVVPTPPPRPEIEPSPRFTIPLPSLEVPDVKKILAEEDLETIRLIESLNDDMTREREAWEKRLKELPGKEQVTGYRERIDAITKARKGGLEGVLGGVEEAQALKQDIEREIDSLRQARTEFENTLSLLRTRLKEVQTAPPRDIQRLQAKYNLSPQGLANVSQALLGPEIGNWVRTGTEWYERLKPFLIRARAAGAERTTADVQKPLRGKGVDVVFQEVDPLPDFLARTAKVSVSLEMGDLAGTIQNMTGDQPTLGKPMTFRFSGDRLTGVKSVSLDGTMNHVVPEDPQTLLDLQARGYILDHVLVSRDDRWPLVLKTGLGDVNMQVELKGRDLIASGAADLKNLQLSAGQPDDANRLTLALSSAVRDISQLSIQAHVKGTPEQYVVRVSSDLDRLVQDAVGKIVSDLAATFGADLQAALSKKIAEPMRQLQSRLSGLESISGELTNRLGRHADILKSLAEKHLPAKGLKDLPGGLKLPF